VLRRRAIISNENKKTGRTEQYESAEQSNKYLLKNNTIDEITCSSCTLGLK
jgi:hypothetical protein